MDGKTDRIKEMVCRDGETKRGERRRRGWRAERHQSMSATEAMR